MSIEYNPATRTNKFTGFDRVKLYLVYILAGIAIIALAVGLFFLNSYRWGSCP